MDTHEEIQYQQDLVESLIDPVKAAAYLEAAMEEDRKAVLLALRNLIKAYQNFAFRHINKLYKLLS